MLFTFYFLFYFYSLGNPLLVVAQKWLTGHPKGAAAAWMTNGLLQAMTTGQVPGNRNADNIDDELKQFDHLLYPNRTIQTTGINAAVLKSFGFGQAGAEVLLIHPKFLYATLNADEFKTYCNARNARESSKYSKRRRSNVAVIIVRIVFISSFFFYCLLLNHSFPTNPNKITNCFKLFSLLQLYNYIAPASLF